jgi:hypothetical protein
VIELAVIVFLVSVLSRRGPMLRTYLSHFHVPAAAVGLLGLALYQATYGDPAHAIGSFVAALGLLGLHLNIPGLPGIDGEGEPAGARGTADPAPAGPIDVSAAHAAIDPEEHAHILDEMKPAKTQQRKHR